MPGKLLIFSAPSGSGKTTIVQHLIKKILKLGFQFLPLRDNLAAQVKYMAKTIISYHKLIFERHISNNEFAEWEEVYHGTYYGTLKAEIERLWSEGKDVIFDVDVIGGLNLKKAYGTKALAVYVDIPDFDHLEQRLRARNTETEDKIQQRLDKARSEREFRNQFDTILLNANLEDTLVKAEELSAKFLA